MVSEPADAKALLTWAKLSEDEIKAQADEDIVIRRDNRPRRSPFVLALNGADTGYYDTLDGAMAAAGKWLDNQRRFDRIAPLAGEAFNVYGGGDALKQPSSKRREYELHAGQILRHPEGR